MNDQNTRRRFLGGLLAAAGSSAAPFALNLAAVGNAAAATATDYKALVCLFMTGGNDHYNTLLATDPESWREYLRLRDTRDAHSIALPAVGAAKGVLPITPKTSQAGRTFALHPQLTGLKTLFDAGRAAAVANVGPLIVPTTRAQYLGRAVPLPPKLFSHNDQQAVWQASRPEGARVGWGGRIADMLRSSNGNSSFACVSTTGNAVYLNGQYMRQYQIAADGELASIDGLNGSVYAGTAPLRSIVTGRTAGVIGSAYADIVDRAIDLEATLSSALVPGGAGGVPAPPPFIVPSTGSSTVNPLALQLQTVARMIASRNKLGMKRQVFFVNLGSFDTHDNQKVRQGDLLARLSHALSYFDSVLGSLVGTDMRKQVTTFTASDFGRSLTSNGDGTDHGWGSHHFVVGGAVAGRNIYGTMPPIGLGHASDAAQGALLPNFSVEQYGATLAKWFGLSAAQTLEVFPNLSNFTQRDLGFMTV